MKLTPAQKARKAKKRLADKAKRQARDERKRQRIARRKEKRAVRTAPKHALAEWSRKALEASGGRCAICGIGVVPKIVDGEQKLNKRRKPIFIPLHVHHLLPKERYPEFKTLLQNSIVLCPLHHKYGKWSAHRNQLWFSEWMRWNRPFQFEWCIKNMGRERKRLKS